MLALRKLLNKPKLTDGHPLAVFYYCDEAVNHQMQELNHLMKTAPDNLDRRATLIRQLKEAQHNLMNVIFAITRQAAPDHHTCRDFRAKYPDDVLVDQINGPLWFGAECIAAGSHILNHELESEQLRPFAVQLSKTISRVRAALKEQCLTNRQIYTQKLKEMLVEFDEMWADFEFRYVGLMCSVKSERQYYHQQDVIVLFCESTLRALKKEYIDHDMIEMMDPSIMFAIPRLAIVCGLVVCPDGPINPSRPSKELPPFFRGYQTLLARIKELLGYLTEEQLVTLEKALCSSEGLGSLNLTTPHTLASAGTSRAVSSASSSPRPLSNPAEVSALASGTNSSTSSLNPQSNLASPRRDISLPASLRPAPVVSHHQRSRSLGSHDLAAQALETTPTREGLNLRTTPTTHSATSCRIDSTSHQPSPQEATADGAPGADSQSQPVASELDAASSRMAVEQFPQFDPNQPIVNDLPMATPIISPPLLPASGSEDKDLSLSPASSPARVREPRRGGPAGRKSGQRRRGPAGFASAEDLMHRLFVAISGVGDQLQTNHAKDLRVILKHVFAVCLSEPDDEPGDNRPLPSAAGDKIEEDDGQFMVQSSPSLSNTEGLGFAVESDSPVSPSHWVPDSQCLNCTACHEPFSWKKRRHHCRSCGQVVCGRCSPHSLPLNPAPSEASQRGRTVRVCNSCYLRQLGVAVRASTTSHTPRTTEVI